MQTGDELRGLDAARRGDRGAFDGLVQPHRKRLLAHCYRMTASLSEADDAVQDTLLRAWRHLGSYEGRASFRGWLYAIATRVCLDRLGDRAGRRVPSLDGSPPTDPTQPPGGPLHDPVWLEPLPDAAWCDDDLDGRDGPEATLDRRQSVALAFVAAIQLLPTTQRAVLLLREVAGWSAAEVAASLEMTVPAVNSAAQRARATLDERAPTWSRAGRPLAPGDRDVLERYARAWRSGDPSLLAATLREDATLAMPPFAAWYAGRDAVTGFLQGFVFAQGLAFEAVAGPSVNGLASVALYAPTPDGPTALRAQGLHLVDLDDRGAITTICAFMDPEAFTRADLPLRLDRPPA